MWLNTVLHIAFLQQCMSDLVYLLQQLLTFLTVPSFPIIAIRSTDISKKYSKSLFLFLFVITFIPIISPLLFSICFKLIIPFLHLIIFYLFFFNCSTFFYHYFNIFIQLPIYFFLQLIYIYYIFCRQYKKQETVYYNFPILLFFLFQNI